jgi:hypothetical protein
VFTFAGSSVESKSFLGTTRFSSDRCSEEKEGWLREAYCEKGKVRFEEVYCEYGCFENRCLKKGGSIEISVTDASSGKSLRSAEVILYTGLLYPLKTIQTDDKGKAVFSNEVIRFPFTMKKLFLQKRVSEPSIFEMHSQQYEVNVQAQGYETQVKSLVFKEGEDVSLEISLEASAASSENVKSITGRVADGNYIKQSPVSYFDEITPDTPYESRKKNPDGSITSTYYGYYGGKVTRTVSRSAHGSRIEVISDDQGRIQITTHTPDLSSQVSTQVIFKEVSGLITTNTETFNADGSVVRTFENSDGARSESIETKNPDGSITSIIDGKRYDIKFIDGSKETTFVTEDGIKYINVDDKDGNILSRKKVNTDGTSEEQTHTEGNLVSYKTFDAERKVTYEKYLRNGKEISKEEYKELVEEVESKKIEELVKMEAPSLFGESKLSKEEMEEENKKESSRTLDFSALVGRSKSCVFRLWDLRIKPRDPLEYKSMFFIEGNVKGTVGCSGRYLVLVTLGDKEIPMEVQDKQGMFRTGPFIADRGLWGGVACGNVNAGEITQVDKQLSLDATQTVAKVAFFYKVYGCSDENICPYGEIEGRKLSACERYYGKKQCLMPDNIDSSCLQQVKMS